MKNILLVGGAGYVGGAISNELNSKNYNLKVYDNLLYEDSYLKDIDFVYGDIRDQKNLKKQLNWSDIAILIQSYWQIIIYYFYSSNSYNCYAFWRLHRIFTIIPFRICWIISRSFYSLSRLFYSSEKRV